MIKKVAILTNGGDAPGLNAVIRGIIKVAKRNNIEVYGYIDGFLGVLNNNYIRLDNMKDFDELLNKGGTIIGSSNNTNLFNFKVVLDNGKVEYKDFSDKCVKQIKENEFDCIFTLGGDGTQKSSYDFSKKGINMIGIPKTIDNDVASTDITFGFLSAISRATEALDCLMTTAKSHKRILVLEVMGRYAGWIALYSAITGGADVCLIPEIEYDLDKVAKYILEKRKEGKQYSLVVVSEGAKEKNGNLIISKILNDGSGLDNIRLGGAGEYVANKLEEITKIPARATVLGHIQRGGSPSPTDRLISTMYGAKAMELAISNTFNILVTLKNAKFSYVDLEEVVGKNLKMGAASGNNEYSNIKKIKMDNQLLNQARNIGICFGD